MVDEQPTPSLPPIPPIDLEAHSLIIALGYYKDLLGAEEAQQVLEQGYCDLDIFEGIEAGWSEFSAISQDDYTYLVGLFKKYNIERRS